MVGVYVEEREMGSIPRGGPVQSVKSGIEVNNLNAALRHIVYTKVETTIFSRYPTLLLLVITGQVGC